MRREGWIIAVAMVAVLAAAPVAHADKRVALVIGNATYNHIAHLPNVSHDAAAMAGLFKSAKFDSVETRHNLGVAELRQALREFASRVADADVAVLFYAGHGIEVGQVNYLVPVDARLATDFDVEDETVSLDRVLQAMEPTRKLRLVILNACRENPFTRSMRRTVAARSVGRGLGRVEPSTTNTLIAYATKPNAIAEDGNGPNSPFTVALVKHLMTPGLDLRIALGHVRDEVLASTGSKQEPYITGSLGGGTISIVGDGTPKSSAVPVPMPLTAADRTWAAVKDTDSISALEAFRRQHGAENPIYDRLAEARIEGLRRQHMALANANPVQSRVDDLLVQAKHRINSGDIVGARKILQAPETATSGPLTFMLAETYDPSMLAIWQVKPDGITANPERARALYAKARELGDARAQQRFEWLAAARPTLPPVPVAPLTGPIIKETVPLVKVVPYRPTEPPVSQPAVNLPEILVTPGNVVPQCVTPGRLMAFLKLRNPDLDPRYNGIATQYKRFGEQLGIRWDYAFFQMVVETGALSFWRDSWPGDVKPEQNNFAGLGATGGARGESFKDIETGVRAHIEHVLLYAGHPVASPVAERTRKLRESGALNDWHQTFRRPITYADLAAKWAPGNQAYAKMLQMIAGRFDGDICRVVPGRLEHAR